MRGLKCQEGIIPLDVSNDKQSVSVSPPLFGGPWVLQEGEASCRATPLKNTQTNPILNLFTGAY